MTQKSTPLVGVAMLVFGLDRLGKAQVMGTLPVGESVPLFGDLLSLTRVETTGAALGLFSHWSAGARASVFGIMSVLCALLVLSFYRGLARGERGPAAALGAILAGVLSNAVDRFRFGFGIDFLQLGSPDATHLPSFNVADVAIVLGVLTLIVELLATEMAARAQEKPRRS